MPGDFKSDIEQSINSGIDMVMLPYGPAFFETSENGKVANTYLFFLKYLKELVNEKKVPLSRIDDAVGRILLAKFNLNLFNKVKTDKTLLSKVGSSEHRNVARECVQQSLVLLKNDNNILPISKNINSIHVTGNGADNLGMQCGGWTISWQGKEGETFSGGTTILSAIKKGVSKKTIVTTSKDASGVKNTDLVVVVIGETPYAEGAGDRKDLNLNEEDIKLINAVEESGKPFVVILLSGRPLIINSVLDNADAFIAAWLPGSEGDGIADVLFGDVNFSGKLSFTWPKNMNQIPINIGDKEYDPLFPYGYGLSYAILDN